MTITASLVKELRDKTSAGMMDCKKALQASEGDFEKAVEWLRKKGLSKAAKRMGKQATEGSIKSYVHGEGRIGVLVEINSETDFVARNELFKNFSKDIAMHIAAMGPSFVSSGEIPQTVIAKEKEILSAKNREQGKQEHIISKIVDGQIKKWCADVCLLDQSFVKDTDKKVSDVVGELSAKLGEKILIRRFVRFELGEGMEKPKGKE